MTRTARTISGLMLGIGLAFSPPAAAKDTPPPDRPSAENLPLTLELPYARWRGAGWRWASEEDGQLILKSSYNLPPWLFISWYKGVQPDLNHMDTSGLLEYFDGDLLEDLRPDTATMAVVRGSHPTLGPTLEIRATGKDAGGRVDLEFRATAFEVASGLAVVAGAGLAGRGGLDAAMSDLLLAITPEHPRVPEEAQARGHVTLESGYSLDLPEGWRALTDEERDLIRKDHIRGGPFDGKARHAIFVAPAMLATALGQSDRGEFPSFSCTTMNEIPPLEVLATEKEPIPASNFKTRLHSLLSGDPFARVLEDGTEQETQIITVDLNGQPHINLEDTNQTLEMLNLGDRDAFYVRAQGTAFGDPVFVAATYTAWDDLSLFCTVTALREDAPIFGVFRQTMASLRVTDGEAHPMAMSISSQYKRWWPWAHPALQLYWLPIPLLVFSLWLAMRPEKGS